ncbi:MAG: cold shock domain protein CspD [Acidimicrobiia bacterium]|nr:cold shock domain protein CspD [Acidimicrobiia bacterium]
MQGVVKVYDPATRVGIVVGEQDRDEFVIRDESLEGSIFRHLRQGQRIIFETVEEDGTVFATKVRIGHEGY